MTNTNQQTHTEKREYATLWSIYRAIEETYEIADATLDGKITKTATTEDGEKVQIPFTHKDGLEFVLDRLSVVLSDIDGLTGVLRPVRAREGAPKFRHTQR